jgi:hypothetical protein
MRWDSTSGQYDMGFGNYAPGLNQFLTRDMYNGALADTRHMPTVVGGGGPCPERGCPEYVAPGDNGSSPGQPVPPGVTNRALYLATIRSAQGEARYGISYDCNGTMFHIGQEAQWVFSGSWRKTWPLVRANS